MMKKILTTALLCLGLSIPVLATAVVDDPALEKALNKEIKKELEMCLDWIRDKKTSWSSFICELHRYRFL